MADDLYLMAHNDSTGRPYIQPRAAGIGLAGALLAELMLAGQLSISSSGNLLPGAVRPADWLADRVLDQIIGEREARAAGEWLLFLGRTAADVVARRLGGAGYLTLVPRRPWRGERWVPADSDCAFMPLTRARAALDPFRPVTVQAAALAGLAAACGLESRLLAYAPPRGRRSPQDAAGLLPFELRELIAQTQAAVDSAVLAQRV
ncbi:MAG: GOLPH3/VPS74 family protein [Streptosporangiaceae bacterium]